MKSTNQNNEIEISKEGLEEIKAELAELKQDKLPQVIKRVAKAREHGDLSENAEYHSARDEQQLVETRIDEIEEILSKAVVVKATKSATKIGMGSSVEIYKKGDAKKKRTITIVGEFEADPGTNKVSSASPLGKALAGKKKGDEVTVTAPAGEVTYVVAGIK